MNLAKILAAVTVLGMVTWALADDEPTTKPKHDAVHGKIVKIDGNDITIKTRKHGDEKAKEIVVKTDDKTVFTLDDKEAKLADLKVDYFIRATPREGTATKVDAFTKPPQRHGHDGPPKEGNDNK